MLANGQFVRPGVHAPEVCGTERGVLETMMAELAARGVVYRSTVEQDA
jgi:hypothetical protein